MAPKRGESIERNDEYEEFMQKLGEYHEKRGTTLDTEPKVGVRHIDLRKLYDRVVGEGGYDLCSDTKAKPLMWRKFAEEFVGKNVYTAAQAFQIKNVYYKNLCAYEISTHWKQEPPPKEILEEVTAKGGNVMTRTLENFVVPTPHKEAAEEASPEQKTPKEEKPDPNDDPGSATGRSTRGLRHQPPQRVLFQPETGSTRQPRASTQLAQTSPSPSNAMNGGYVPPAHMANGTTATLASYEPSQAYPLSLRPVTTPANNPEFYRYERKRKLEAAATPLAKRYRNIMLPGTGFIGPNIYVRAQFALQSGIPEEEQYALHHLVKISHERGDKYRFEQFPGLSDALIKKVLQVTGLFYDVSWDITYDENSFPPDDETLNGLRPTTDLHERLSSRMALISDDSVLDAGFLSQLNRITEATLVLRNMALLEDNALHLARNSLVQDLLAIVLNLPRHSSIIEMQHYALDIAEQVLRHVDVGTRDALYHGLLSQVYSGDRGAMAGALRSISRIAMNLPHPKRLDDIPLDLLKLLPEYLLVEDEELRSACLDFLSQYTTFADNVNNILRYLDAPALASRLSQLLLFTAKEIRDQRDDPQPLSDIGSYVVPRLSKSVVESLLKLDEPERSSEWLRICCYAEPKDEMTQISLWQAYQGTFAPYHSTHPHLIAGDFIKNVSNTFQGATAQVAGSNKYVIRGIKARKVPLDTGTLAGAKSSDKGKELLQCQWKVAAAADKQPNAVPGLVAASITTESPCGEWFRSSTDMLSHILEQHLQIPTRPKSVSNEDAMDIDPAPADGSAPLTNGLPNGTTKPATVPSFNFRASDPSTLACKWSGSCTRTSADFDTDVNVSRTQLFVRHIATHLPQPDKAKTRHNIKPETILPPLNGSSFRLGMIVDERGEATGVPLRATTVLRNLARFMPKSYDSLGASRWTDEKLDEAGSPMSTVFTGEVCERLYYAMSFSKTMRAGVGSVFKMVDKGGV